VTAHLGDLLQGVLLPSGLGPVDRTVVERLAGQVHHLGLGHHSQAQLGVDQRGSRLRQVALVRQ